MKRAPRRTKRERKALAPPPPPPCDAWNDDLQLACRRPEGHYPTSQHATIAVRDGKRAVWYWRGMVLTTDPDKTMKSYTDPEWDAVDDDVRALYQEVWSAK